MHIPCSILSVRCSTFNVRCSIFSGLRLCQAGIKCTATLFFLLCLPLHAAGTSLENQSKQQPAATNFSYSDALILGLVEGITEYLPISSTGHLIITNALLGLDGDAPVTNDQGQPILVKENENLRAYTIGEAAYAYAIVIQAGAIAAVCLLYWRTLLKIALGIFGKDAGGRKLALNLSAAFVPAAIFGLLLDDWIEATLGDNVMAVASALIVGAGAMLGVETWRSKKLRRSPNPRLREKSRRTHSG